MIKSNIREIMKKKKLRIRDISEQYGLSSTTLTKARTDEGIRECRLSTLERIAEALGVSTKKLYDEVKEEEANSGNEDKRPTKAKDLENR